MQKPVRLAIAGLGRMGIIHALHIHEFSQKGGNCKLAALCDANQDRAKQVAAELGCDVPIYGSVEELGDAGVADATVVVVPTDQHRACATALIARGHRVLVEKPLTGTLAADLEFAAELDAKHPHALMLGFQRRFDPALQYAKSMMENGAIGRIFKVYSAMEDSLPAPNGYQSGGLLSDMAIHNVDEVLWLTGKYPNAALMMGSRIYSHKLTTAEEDFDDALLCLWYKDDMAAQIQVGRNHVSGYRTETVIYGEEGVIQVDLFHQKAREVIVQAYGRYGSEKPLASRTFVMREYDRPLPEFARRFGLAYMAELAAFIDCCQANKPFPITHRDGARAQQVIEAGMLSKAAPQAIPASQ
jgi:myo-inositol 2-dehydrogenase/D-chiro-inositol 1-dehydrogenase